MNNIHGVSWYHHVLSQIVPSYVQSVSPIIDKISNINLNQKQQVTLPTRSYAHATQKLTMNSYYSALLIGGLLLSISGGRSALAAGGIFINDGTDNGCIIVSDNGGPVFITVQNSAGNCASGNATTQTNRILFYNPTGAAAGNSTHLSIGGKIDVNSIGSAINGLSLKSQKLTNLAIGTVATDGVNISQLTSVVNTLGGGANLTSGVFTGPSYTLTGITGTPFTTVGAALTGLSTSIGALNSGTVGLVTQATSSANILVGSASTGTVVNFTNSASISRTLTGVAAGNIATSTSTDAVNGGQLFTTNTNVTTVTTNLASNATAISSAMGGGSTVTAGVVTAPTYTLSALTGSPFNNVGSALTAVNTAIGALNTGTTGLVTQATPSANILVGSTSTGTVVNFTNSASATRTLTGLSAGNIVSSTSTDAVTGGQLFTTNTTLSSNATAIASAFGGGSTVTAGVVTAPSYTLSALSGSPFNNVGSALTAVNTSITSLNTSIATLNSGTTGLVTQVTTNSPILVGSTSTGTVVNFTNSASVARTLTGIANGASASDAVNFSQLSTTNTNVTNVSDSLSSNVTAIASALGGGSTVTGGIVTAPSYTLSALTGSPFNNVGSALTAVNTSITSVNTAITALNSGTTGLVTQATTSSPILVGSNSTGTVVNFTNSGSIARTLTGIANGTSAADAVNFSQLSTTDTNVTNLNNSLSNNATAIANALGGGSTVTGGVVTAPSYTLSAFAGSPFNNVGSALTAVDTSVTSINTSIGSINTSIAALNSGTSGLVTQATPSSPILVGSTSTGTVVSFVNSASASRTLTGVANGSSASDAVNFSQLSTTNTNVTNVSNSLSTNAAAIASAFGGDSTVTGGVVTAPSYTLSALTGSPFNNVGSALTAFNTAVTSLNTSVSALNSGMSGLVTQATLSAPILVGSASTGTVVDFTNNASISRTLTGIASGVGASDAVNVSQLTLTNTNVTDINNSLNSNTLAIANALGGDSTVTSGVVTAPNYVLSTLTGTPFNSVGSALDAFNTSVGALNTSVAALNSGTSGLVTQTTPSDPILVGSTSTGTMVNFTNSASSTRTLTGITAGNIAAGSLEAINGSQLFATNTQLNTNITTLAAVLGTTATAGILDVPSYLTSGYTDVKSALNGLQVQISNITTGDTGLVLQNDISPFEITIGAATAGSIVNITGSAGTRVLTGVTDGNITTASTEAVNGNQLYNIVTALGATAPAGVYQAPVYSVGGNSYSDVKSALSRLDLLVTGLGSGAIGLVEQIPDTNSPITIGNGVLGTVIDITNSTGGLAGARTLTGVAAGNTSANSLDAINGSQLYSTNTLIEDNATAVAAALGGSASVTSGVVTAPNYVLTNGTFNDVGSALGSLNTDIATNTSDISTINTSLGSNTTALATALGGSSTVVSGVVTAPSYVLTNGTFNDVGSALSSLNTDIASNTNSITTTNTTLSSNMITIASALGGGSTVTSGVVTAPSYALASGTFNDVGSALGSLNTSVVNNTSSISTINTTLTSLTNGTTGLVTQANPTDTILVGSGSLGSTVDFTNNVGGLVGARILTGVAAGNVAASSLDAINGSQLDATNTSIADNATAISNAFGGGSSVIGGVVTVPSYILTGGTFSNVGAALGSLNTDIAGNLSSINTINTTLSSITSGTAGIITQANPTATILVGSTSQGTLVDFTNSTGSLTGARILTGVAAGSVTVNSLDAVNGSQIFNTNNLISDNTNMISNILGGGATVISGVITAPNYVLTGGTFSNIGAALGSLNTDIASNVTSITTLNNALSNLTSGTTGLVTQANPTATILVGSTSQGTVVDFTNNVGGLAGARTLTGVAAGNISANSLDAINGSQLYSTNTLIGDNANAMATALGGSASVTSGVITAPSYVLTSGTFNDVGSALGSLNTDIAANTSNISTINTTLSTITSGTAGLVTQASLTDTIFVGSASLGNLVDFTNSTGGIIGARILSGIAAGNITANSLEAINGSQLYTTNTLIANNALAVSSAFGGGSIVTSGVVTAPTYILTGGTFSDVGSALSSLNTDIATHTSSINTLDTTLNGNTAALANALGGGSTVAGNIITAPSYILASGTFDNVGAALGSLDTGIINNTSSINTLNTNLANITSGTTGIVTQASPLADIFVGSASAGALVDFTNNANAARILRGVANGTNPLDAVNFSQLSTTNTMVTALDTRLTTNLSSTAMTFGGGAQIAAGIFTAPTYNVAGFVYNNVGDALDGLNTAITNISTGPLAIIKQAPISNIITIGDTIGGSVIDLTGTAGARTLRGVATGNIALGSVDAVNGDQVYTNLNAIATALGGGSTITGGIITAPTYALSRGTFNNVADALLSLDTDIDHINTTIMTSMVIYDADNPNQITLGARSPSAFSTFAAPPPVLVTNVADGNIAAGSSDAMTGNQLYNVVATINELRELVNSSTGGTGTSAATAMIAIENSYQYAKPVASGKDTLAVGAGSVASGEDAVAVGMSGVATGRGAIAVGTQSSATGNYSIATGDHSRAVGEKSVAIGQNAQAIGNNSVALGANSIADRDNSVSVGSFGAERTITNVAPGIAGTDAVNVNQLNQGLDGLRTATNQRLNDLNSRVKKLDKKATGGIASAMAMSGLPQATIPGSSLASAAISGYDDRAALAIGLSKISQDGKWIIKLQGSANTTGKVGATVGIGYQW